MGVRHGTLNERPNPPEIIWTFREIWWVQMETQEITIRVSPLAANVYKAASEEERRKLGLLLSLKLGEVQRGKRPLEEIGFHIRSTVIQSRPTPLGPAIGRRQIALFESGKTDSLITPFVPSRLPHQASQVDRPFHSH